VLDAAVTPGLLPSGMWARAAATIDRNFLNETILAGAPQEL
jgi:hypothetical protein